MTVEERVTAADILLLSRLMARVTDDATKAALLRLLWCAPVPVVLDAVALLPRSWEGAA